MAKEKIVKEWFDKGHKDIEDAEFLLENESINQSKTLIKLIKKKLKYENF